MALPVAIYKFACIAENEIEKIYVFAGENLTELFSNEPSNKLFKDIFSEAELQNITEKKINVVFVESSIYLDDTIEVIKKKLLAEARKDAQQQQVSFGEMYFYIKRLERLNTITVYKNLTQNEKLELTKERLSQFLLNLDESFSDKIASNDIYSYEDLLVLELDTNPIIINKPLGQKFVAVGLDMMSLPYIVNPYDVIIGYDRFLEQFADDLTTTTNTNLLLESGPFENNMIYVCFATDVLNFMEDEKINIRSSLKIYFPYLFAQDRLVGKA